MINRRELRLQRRQLNHYQQRQAETRLCLGVTALPVWRNARKVGIYLHAFGEIATGQLILQAFRQGKQVYLPQVTRMNQALRWVRITLGQYQAQRFYQHRLGMQQPMQRGIAVQQLNLLCMPLLAADYFGTRLGMGGGFYDRSLANAPHQPYRLGLAHDFQLLTTPLTRQAWDQSLDALALPQQILKFKRSSRCKK